MRDQLARLGARRAEAHAIDDVVQPRFQQLQQVRTGRALVLRGHGEGTPEHALENAVGPAQFLLLAQLIAVVRLAHAGFHAMLPRLGIELALRVERSPRAFQEEISPLPPRQLAFRSGVSSHLRLPAESKNLLSTDLVT